MPAEEPIGENAEFDPGFESRFPAIGDRECQVFSVFGTFRWGASCGTFIYTVTSATKISIISSFSNASFSKVSM